MSVSVHESFCIDSAQDRFYWMDHFLGDQLQDEWRSNGTGSAVVVDAQTGGIVRITTGAVDTNTHQIDWNNIRSLHVDQKVTMEWRVKVTDITNISVAVGLFFDFNNFIYFNFSTGIGANWQIRCADGGAGPNVDSGIAADTDYHIFRIEAFPTGQVHFYIDGVETANSPITTNIPDDAADFLQPWFFVQTFENATKSIDVDYVAARQER